MEKLGLFFAKCNWIGGNFKISEGWFCKHVFLTLSPVKNIYIYPKVAFEMYVLKCVKILGKVVKIRVFMSFYKSTSPFMQVVELQK
jgi:hypothetical protein